jgi:hypothetical protein
VPCIRQRSGRAGADVDDQHVVEHVEAVGHREGLRAEHDRVDPLLGGVEDRALVVDRGLRRGADHRVDELVLAGLGAADDLADQVLGGLEVVLEVAAGLAVAGLDHAVLQRAEEVQREALLDGLVAEQHVLLEQLAADDVLRVADVRRTVSRTPFEALTEVRDVPRSMPR